MANALTKCNSCFFLSIDKIRACALDHIYKDWSAKDDWLTQHICWTTETVIRQQWMAGYNNTSRVIKSTSRARLSDKPGPKALTQTAVCALMSVVYVSDSRLTLCWRQ